VPAPLEPYTFRNGVTLPNRVALAPLTNLQSHDDGTLSDTERRVADAARRRWLRVIETCAAYVADRRQGLAR
jgi:2,4-dienoyl-CoA reductase-like NADH-dependent reductase (Old Yellow Enzyme family)